MEKSIQTPKGEIRYILNRKRVKNINFRVKEDGILYVSANRRVPLSEIEKLIVEKSAFYFNALEKIKSRPQKTASGFIYILGKKREIKVYPSSAEKYELSENTLSLYLKNPKDEASKDKLLKNFLFSYAQSIFGQICQRAYLSFIKYNLPYPAIKIKDLKSRWGVCHIKKNEITLNLKLIFCPEECIEYVVFHEFSHFLYPNHSKDFHAFLGKLMPDYKERKKLLNT